MDKEEIIKIIKDEVSKEFGAERIKDIEYFGPYEGEDLDVIVYVEGIDERKDGLDVGMRLSDTPAAGGCGSRGGACGGGCGRWCWCGVGCVSGSGHADSDGY